MKLPLPILPGAWLGILGGGQLGRMFCFAAQSMGYSVCVFDPSEINPAAAVADHHICADYNDQEALRTFAHRCAAVSTEFENIPAQALEIVSEITWVHPSASAIAVSQDRTKEKAFLENCGVKVSPYCLITEQTTLDESLVQAYLPGILKTARMGYDGKGQIRVETFKQLCEAHQSLNHVPCVLEKFQTIAYEISIVLARTPQGNTAAYTPAQNVHKQGILDLSFIPTLPTDQPASPVIQTTQKIAKTIAAQLQYVGVLCVEFFVLPDGQCLVNEIAPRPHNSGHYTIDACTSNQFDQQVRCMTGLPLASTRQHSPAIMLNLLGDLWFEVNGAESGEVRGQMRTPPWDAITDLPEAHLHLYGKKEARPGRKMGHITFIAPTFAQAQHALEKAQRLLGISTTLTKAKLFHAE